MKISWSIFPKFFKHLSVPELAQLVRDVGLDTTNAVVRDGFWVSRESFAADLPLFVKQMSDEGLTVSFATAGFMPGEILADESLLATLTDSGVAEFRMGYFSWDKSKTPGACADDARRQLEQIVPLLQRVNAEARNQNTLFPVGLQIEGVQRGGAGTGIDLGLDVGESEIGQADPFTPADDFTSIVHSVFPGCMDAAL